MTTPLDPQILAAYDAVRKTANKAIFCHAPFVNLNFAQNGAATVCCYNREYVVGTYPADSLSEMWFGSRARDLRSMMAQNQLPSGCDLCLSQFSSRNFAGLRAQSFDHLADADSCGDDEASVACPKRMEFEISNVCNLECTMCSGFFSSAIRRNREHLPPLRSPYDEAFLHQLEPFIPHLRDARFLGGEPFLVGAYYRIWDMIVRLNPSIDVGITTNATILNDRIRGVLEGMRCHIVASVDSLDRDSYERIRVNADYDGMRANLEYFISYAARKNTRMTLAVCPMRYNWREVPRIVRFCNERGLHVYFNTVFHPADASLMYMCHDELEEVIRELGASLVGRATGIPGHNWAQFSDLLNQIGGFAGAKIAPSDRLPNICDVGTWTLELQGRNRASLARGPEPGGVTRVTINELAAGESWHVRLVAVPVPVKSNRRYVASFRARSDCTRHVSFGTQGAPPTTRPLGPCVGIWLSPDWHRFEVEFVPEADDMAELFFTLGESQVPVEVADMTLCAAADGPRESGR
jgi:MoaA/NifB/PqqE/SkfB family radical SAM enzyme